MMTVRSAAARAAANMLALGTKDSVPSLFTMVSAFARTDFPINGPTIPGIST